MKKLAAVFILSAFLFGCGASATQSEFWIHDSLYKNWDHTWFSLSGYKTREMIQEVNGAGTGVEIPYIPAR
jgi:hypothetical protein